MTCMQSDRRDAEDRSAHLSASPPGARGSPHSCGGSKPQLRCGAPAQEGPCTSVLRCTATFFTVKALLGHNSSRPVSPDSTWRGRECPEGGLSEQLRHCRLVCTCPDGPASGGVQGLTPRPGAQRTVGSGHEQTREARASARRNKQGLSLESKRLHVGAPGPLHQPVPASPSPGPCRGGHRLLPVALGQACPALALCLALIIMLFHVTAQGQGHYVQSPPL